MPNLAIRPQAPAEYSRQQNAIQEQPKQYASVLISCIGLRTQPSSSRTYH